MKLATALVALLALSACGTPRLTSTAHVQADVALVTKVGILEQVAGIGGESTGFAIIMGEGKSIEVDLTQVGSYDYAASFVGEQVKIVGHIESRGGVERGSYEVLVAQSIRPAMPMVTCMAYWMGFEFDSETNTCIQQGASGCSNPFTFSTLADCQAKHPVAQPLFN